jgi:putative acetyltransferase
MNVASFVIRCETADDHDAIRRVVSAAFGSDAEADLVERIRASPEYVPELALVAVTGDGAIVGHVMVSRTTLHHVAGERTIAMLSPLAVHPGHQGGGIGGALVRAVTALADRRGEPVVILEGSPTYYSRFGFEHSARHGIEIPLPDWAPAEAAQVLLLSSYDPADATLRGRVVYPAAFDGIE